MLDNEDLDEVLDPTGRHPPPRFLLLGPGIRALKPSRKDLLCLGPRHLERQTPIGSDRVLPEPRPSAPGTVERDEHPATTGGHLDAESGQASIPMAVALSAS